MLSEKVTLVTGASRSTAKDLGDADAKITLASRRSSAMLKKILTVTAVALFATSTPVLAEMASHQNPSLNGYVGHATDEQYAQPTAFRTGPEGHGIQAAGSGNPSVESFTPNAVDREPTLYRTAPSIAENPDFNWIDQADIGA